MIHRHNWRALGLAAVAVVLIAATLIACGSDDPYSGTWTGDKGKGSFTITIQKANDGWWMLDMTPEGIQTYGAEIDGELQTMNGGTSYKRSGDNLEFTIHSEKGEPAILTRQ
jgi:hypothetical protein